MNQDNDRKSKFDDVFHIFKESFKGLYSKVDSHIEYLSEEIDIRIESIKLDLDRLGGELKLKLNENRVELDKFARKIEKTCYEKDLIEFNPQLQQHEEMCKLIEEMSKYSIPVTVGIGNESPDVDLIGVLKPNFNSVEDRLFRLNECFNSSGTSNYDVIDLTTRITDIGVLSDNCFLTANYDHSCLTLYNKKFHLLKTVTKLNDKEIHPICVSVDRNKGEIAVSDYTLHRVYILDYSLNLLRTIGDDNNEARGKFQFPFGVAYDHEGNLLVCDKVNKCIQVFESNYQFLRKIKLNYEPYYIKILDNTVCVTTYSNVYFYDLATFELKYHYKDHFGTFGVILDSYFLEYDFENEKIYYFDKNGCLINEISSELFKQKKLITRNSWETLVYFNDKLLITSEKLKKLFII